MSQRDFEAIWSALPFPAFVIGADATIAEANMAAEVFGAISAKQMNGASVEHMAGAESILADVVNQVRGGVNSVVLHDVEIGWAGANRGIANVQVSRLDGGEVLLVLHPRGIADKMDRSLAHRSAARSVTGMASMLAHEIRNPLAGISGAAQLLAMNLPPQDRELTDMIEGEAKRIGKLVDRVESFGDQRPLEITGVNIHDVLERAKSAAKAGFARHVRFAESYDPSLPEVAGNADSLIQVFLNLLKNAAEAQPKRGQITLKTAYRPGIKLSLPGGGNRGLPIEIVVSDSGPGIPENMGSSVFDPFVSSKPNGSGLGLSLVSKVVADHGGIVECESSDKGTKFQILLPVWPERRV